MNPRVLIAALAGGVAAFLMGWLVFGILTADFYKANTNHYGGLDREDPSMIGVFAANVLFAYVLAYVFDKWGSVKSFMNGAVSAVMIMVPFVAAINLLFWSFMNLMGKKLLIVDVVLNGVVYAVAGGVIALVLHYKKAI